MQQTQEKNGQTGLVLLLVLMILFVAYHFVLRPILNKEKPSETNSNEPEETEEQRIARIGGELYRAFSLSLEEESVLTDMDRTYLENRLSLYNMSDEFKLYVGFKNLDPKYLTNEPNYNLSEAVKNANGNYYYSGKYILVDPLEEVMIRFFGDLPIYHKTITLDNIRYIYDEAQGRYEVWEAKDKVTSSVKKITYTEVANNQNELYIYEYVAYTDYKDPANLVTSTTHSGNIEVVITPETVSEYLNYMDKYRYVFKKQEDGSYLFSAIEYAVE